MTTEQRYKVATPCTVCDEPMCEAGQLTGPYRYRHPETFVVPETTDPVQAIQVAEDQAKDARRRAMACLEALSKHDAHGLLLLDEWRAAVAELDAARSHHAATLAQWADVVVTCNPPPKGPHE